GGKRGGTRGMNAEAISRAIDRLQKVAGLLAVLGVALCLFFFVHNQFRLLHAYLYGWFYWVGLTIGFFGLTLLINVTRSKWGRPILRIAEAGGGPVMLVVMGLLFLPILFGASSIYP